MSTVVLAPMKEVSLPPFWLILEEYGRPDAYFSQFIRVHANYLISERELKPLLAFKNVFVQFLGNDLEALKRNIDVLLSHNVQSIDFNMGCPVSRIQKKAVGGGLLKTPDRIAVLLKSLRQFIPVNFSVKLRLGFENTDDFLKIIDICNEAEVDLITVHARTVSDLYRATPRYEFITEAVKNSRCPVLANGDLHSVPKCLDVLKLTGCAGVMIGRAAIRNPWIFNQWRSQTRGEPLFRPTFAHAWGYFEKLYSRFELQQIPEKSALGVLKRFANYVGQSVDPSGVFLSAIRQTRILVEFWKTGEQFLLKNGAADQLLSLEPFSNLFADINKEKP